MPLHRVGWIVMGTDDTEPECVTDTYCVSPTGASGTDSLNPFTEDGSPCPGRTILIDMTGAIPAGAAAAVFDAVDGGSILFASGADVSWDLDVVYNPPDPGLHRLQLSVRVGYSEQIDHIDFPDVFWERAWSVTWELFEFHPDTGGSMIASGDNGTSVVFPADAPEYPPEPSLTIGPGTVSYAPGYGGGPYAVSWDTNATGPLGPLAYSPVIEEVVNEACLTTGD